MHDPTAQPEAPPTQIVVRTGDGSPVFGAMMSTISLVTCVGALVEGEFIVLGPSLVAAVIAVVCFLPRFTLTTLDSTTRTVSFSGVVVPFEAIVAVVVTSQFGRDGVNARPGADLPSEIHLFVRNDQPITKLGRLQSPIISDTSRWFGDETPPAVRDTVQQAAEIATPVLVRVSSRHAADIPNTAQKIAGMLRADIFDVSQGLVRLVRPGEPMPPIGPDSAATNAAA